MGYSEWKLNQEINHRNTFEKDDEFKTEYKEYLKNELRKKKPE
jgi:hypothetical protein